MNARDPSTPGARLAFALTLLALAAAGCRARTVRPAELSEHAVALDLVPSALDARGGCGVAALSALCAYWGVDVPPGERAALARIAAEETELTGGDLRAALDRLGLDASLFRGALDRSPAGLYRHLDDRRPALVRIAREGESPGHYALVLGYDEPRGNVLVLDPERGRVLVAAEELDRAWERCERFTLLASPRADVGAPQEAAPAFAPSPASTRVSTKGIDG